MISPEGYSEEYLKGKNAEQIMTAIRGLKQEIGHLKNTMEQTQDSTSNFEFSIIEPSNIEELVKALEVQSMLELLVKDGNAKYETLLNSERANITRYIDSIGKFNNVQMIVNLNFLLKNID